MIASLFIFPGLLFIFDEKAGIFDPDDFLKTLAGVVLISLAFWVSTYWMSGILPFSLSKLYVIMSIHFLAGFLILLFKRGVPKTNWRTQENLILLAVFLLLVYLRFLSPLSRITGSVGDMTQHNDMTRIILLHDGFSRTYEPLYAFANFGEYPLGFHTLSAILARWGGLPFYRATAWTSAVPYILLHLALYCFCARRFTRIFSLALSSLVLLLSHYPQFLNQWGSSSTALSAAFLFYGFYLLTEAAGRESLKWRLVLAAALVLSAGVLSHLIPPVGFAFYFAAWLLLKLFSLPNARARILKTVAVTAGLAAVFILPFLFNFNFSVFTASKASISLGHENSVARLTSLIPFESAWVRFPAETVLLFAFLFGPVLSSAIFISFPLCRDRAVKIEFLAFLAAYLLLLICFNFKITPAWHLFQLERVHYFLLIPSCLLIGCALSPLEKARPALKLGLSLGALLLLCAGALEGLGRRFESHYTAFKNDRRLLPFVLRDLGFGSFWAYALDLVNAGVTPQDLKAFEWIEAHAEPGAVFLVNYGDAGHLIPSFTLRRIPDPHGMEIWHGRELEAWQAAHPATHIYIGENPSPAYPVLYRKEDLSKLKGAKKLYESGRTAVFRGSK